jgi:hypothetical protein
MIEISGVPPGVDPARPSPARVCDYLDIEAADTEGSRGIYCGVARHK